MDQSDILDLVRKEISARLSQGALIGFGDGGGLLQGISTGVNGGCVTASVTVPLEMGPPDMPRPFDITELSASNVTVSRLYYLRGPVWIEKEGTASLDVSTGTTCTVCAKINTQDGTVALSLTPDLTLPEDASEFINVPLYKLSRASASHLWTIDCDLRGSAVVLYA